LSYVLIAQHVDNIAKNEVRATGFIFPESVKQEGISGSLLNHSEHRINMREIISTIKLCDKLNLKLIVCVANLKEARQVKKLNPYAIAFEDPKLIATGKSITNYRADDLKKFALMFKNSKTVPLCGAGINCSEDYHQSIRFGCKGVLIASAVMKSKNPEKFLNDFF